MTQTSLGYSYSVPNICYHYDDYDRDQHDDYQHDDHDHHFYDYIIITTNGNNSETKTIIMIYISHQIASQMFLKVLV